MCQWLQKDSHVSFTKHLEFLQGKSKRIRRRRVVDSPAWLLTRGKVGCGSAGPANACMREHAIPGTPAWNTIRLPRYCCSRVKMTKASVGPPTLLSANNPPLGSLSVRLVQINIRVTVSRIQRHTASPTFWQSDFKVAFPYSQKTWLFHFLGRGFKAKSRKLLNFPRDLQAGLALRGGTLCKDLAPLTCSGKIHPTLSPQRMRGLYLILGTILLTIIT